MDVPAVVSLARDIIVAGAGITGACVAVCGLRTWRRQLLGAAEYDLAKRLLRAVYEWREAIARLRHPFMWAEEMRLSDGHQCSSMEHDHDAGVVRAYQRRWDGVRSARLTLDTVILEAEVVWGQEVRRDVDSLLSLQLELFDTVSDYVRGLALPGDQRPRITPEQLRQRHSVLYLSGRPEDDEFGQRVTATIAGVERMLQPHIGRRLLQ